MTGIASTALEQARADLAAFDRLPPRVRRALTDAPVNLSAEVVERLAMTASEHRIVRGIEDSR